MVAPVITSATFNKTSVAVGEHAVLTCSVTDTDVVNVGRTVVFHLVATDEGGNVSEPVDIPLVFVTGTRPEIVTLALTTTDTNVVITHPTSNTFDVVATA